MSPSLLRRKQRGSAPREAVRAAIDQVALATVGVRPGGLRVDADRLTVDEQLELCNLSREISADAPPGQVRFDPSRLEKKQLKRWRSLVEKGAGEEEGLFDSLDQLAKLGAELADQARERRATRRPRWEEKGALIIPAQVFADLDRLGPAYGIEGLLALMLVLGSLESGRAIPAGSWFEDDETIVVSGIGASLDPEGRIPASAFRIAIQYLARVQWLEIENRGAGQLACRRGPKALKLAGGRG
jgi:hypothetical protein